MKKLLILILLFSLTGCSSQVDLGAKKEKKEKPVKIEKLKASKNNILKSETIDECAEWRDEKKIECLKTKKVKQYHYISDKKVGKQKIDYKGVELEEDLSKRTKNSVHFKIPKDEKLLGASEEQGDTYVAKIYAGDPFYEEDTSKDGETEWYQTESATTTIENYNNNNVSTSTVISNFIRWMGGYEVLADSGTFYSSAGDGYVQHVLSAGTNDWDTTHDASTAASFSYTGTDSYIGACQWDRRSGRGYYRIWRGLLNFDTSSIPSSASVSDTSLYTYINASYDPHIENDLDYIALTKQSQTDEDTITGSDYSEFENIISPPVPPSKVYVATSSSNITTIKSYVGSYYEFEFNSTGVNAIKKDGETSDCGTTNGYTCIGGREAHDAEDVSVLQNVGTANTQGVLIASSEYTGTLRDPYLEVTYVAGTVSRRIMLIN